MATSAEPALNDDDSSVNVVSGSVQIEPAGEVEDAGYATTAVEPASPLGELREADDMMLVEVEDATAEHTGEDEEMRRREGRGPWVEESEDYGQDQAPITRTNTWSTGAVTNVEGLAPSASGVGTNNVVSDSLMYEIADSPMFEEETGHTAAETNGHWRSVSSFSDAGRVSTGCHRSQIPDEDHLVEQVGQVPYTSSDCLPGLRPEMVIEQSKDIAYDSLFRDPDEQGEEFSVDEFSEAGEYPQSLVLQDPPEESSEPLLAYLGSLVSADPLEPITRGDAPVAYLELGEAFDSDPEDLYDEDEFEDEPYVVEIDEDFDPNKTLIRVNAPMQYWEVSEPRDDAASSGHDETRGPVSLESEGHDAEVDAEEVVDDDYDYDDDESDDEESDDDEFDDDEFDEDDSNDFDEDFEETPTAVGSVHHVRTEVTAALPNSLPLAQTWDRLESMSRAVTDALLGETLPSFDERFPPGAPLQIRISDRAVKDETQELILPRQAELPYEDPSAQVESGEPFESRGEPTAFSGDPSLGSTESPFEEIWDSEVLRPVDEALARQAQIRAAVEQRIEMARRRRAAER
jgi:hypothetical protein